MKILKSAIICFVLLSALVSCKTEFDLMLEGNDIDGKYAMAFDLFNKGKYYKSSQLFESLSLMTSGTAKDDTVQYYRGLSNYRYKDFYTAETNFKNFIDNYPVSPFTENATFLRLDCMFRQTLRYELDQTPTRTTMVAISDFIAAYPESPQFDVCISMMNELSERLDRKAYESAKLYYKMEDYLAARVALKNVLKDDSENMYREDILYYIAMATYKYASMSVEKKQKERYLEFVDDYLNFIGEYPESAYRKELDGLYKKSQRALGKYVPEDDEEIIVEK